MTTIISGSGLGLFNTSANLIGTSGNPLSGRPGQSDAVYVNSATGNVVIQAQDEFLASVGLDANLVRTYNSRGNLSDDNGDNWRLNVSSLINRPSSPNSANSTVTKRFGDGAEIIYTYDSARNLYVSTAGDGADDTISFASNLWTWTDGDSRVTEIYNNSNGRLDERRDADGNKTVFTYNGSGLLTKILDQTGESLVIVYRTSNAQQIQEIQQFSSANVKQQTLVRYGYDGFNRLTSVTVDLSPADNVITDGKVYVTTYTYDPIDNTNKRIASITNGDGTKVSFTYESDGAGGFRVKTYTDGEGKTTTLTYSTTSITLPTSADVRGLTTPASTAVKLTGSDSTTANAMAVQFKFDQSGNGMALWLSNFNVMVSRYIKDTDTWTTQPAINAGIAGSPDTANPPHLSMSENGNALVTWIQAGHVYATRYTKSGSTWSWSAITRLENQSFAAVKPIGAINNAGRAVVAFVNWDGSANNLYVNVFNGTSWGSATKLDDLGGNDTKDIDALMPRPALAIDVNGNATALWLQPTPTATIDSARFSRYTASSNSWSNVDSTTLNNGLIPAKAVDAIQLAFDGAGNGVAVWLQDGSLYAKSYTASTNSWSAMTNLGMASAVPNLALASNGNGIVSWVNGSDILARRYAAGAWVGSAPETIENAAGQAGNPTASINNNGQAVVAFVQLDAAGVRNVYANRFSGGAWQGATLLESNTTAVAATMIPSVGIDAAGMVEVLWTQFNAPTNTDAVFTNRFNTDAFYKVKAGDTWATIALATYGDSAAASALQAALGNPTLTTGLVLTGFPARLDYTVTLTNAKKVDVSDPLAQVTTYISDSKGLLRQVMSPTVAATRFTVTFSYDSKDNLIQTLDANGNRTNSLYDANDNLLLSRDALGNTLAFTYSATNQILTETRFLTPDPDGAGPQLPTNPMTTRYVYDAENHLRFVISGAGRVSESRYDTPGNLAASIAYTASSFDLTGRGPTDALTLSDLTSWLAARTGGELTKTQRVDYTLDSRGQVSSATTYATISATGAGVIDGNESVTKFIYDLRGLLLQTIDARGSSQTPNATNPNLSFATTYTYDGMGRVTSAIDWEKTNAGTPVTRSTLTAYDDAGNRILTTQANGLVTTSVFDKRGLLVSVTAPPSALALGTTTYKYDAAGQLRLTTDPVGNKTYALYDAAGRAVALIDATGALIENLYDNAGNLTKAIAYANRLSAAQLASLLDASGNPTNVTLASVRPVADATRDRATRYVYDAADRLVMTIAAHDTDATKGFVTQTFYDGAGRVTDVVGYAKAITVTTLPAVPTPAAVTALIVSSSDDRLVRSFYDNDGGPIGTLDGEGGFCEYVYDGAGELTQTIHYAMPIDATLQDGTLRSAATFAQLKNFITTKQASEPDTSVKSKLNNQQTYNFYSAKGELIGLLDQEGYLTEYAYDKAGNQTQAKRYTNKANAFTGTPVLASLRPAAHANDAVSVSTYNGVNELTSIIDNPAGTETRFTYDGAGNLIKAERAFGTSEVRTTETRYKPTQRQIQELTARGSEALAAFKAANPGATPAQIDAIWDQWSVTSTYDVAGRLISSVDQNGNKTLFFYDEDNRLRFSVAIVQVGEIAGDPLFGAEVSEMRYNALGDVSETFSYSARLGAATIAGLTGGAVTPALIGAVAALANGNSDAHASFNYTLRGSVKEAIQAQSATQNFTTSYTYNAFGELATRLDPVVNVAGASNSATSTLSKYTYDHRGLLVSALADADNGTVVGIKRTASTVYDAFGRVIQITDGNGNLRTLGYDRLGRVLALTDAAGTHTSTYDAFDRVLTEKDALNNTTATFVYNDTARSFTLTTAQGITVTTTLNRHGETATFVDGNANTSVYTYDKDGNLTNVREASGTLNLDTASTFDRADRLVTVTDPNGRVVKFAYDGANRVLTRTLDPKTISNPNDNPNGLDLVTRYTYDGQGQALTVTDPRGTATKFTYDAKGQVTEQAVDPTDLNLRTHFTYDAQGRALTMTQGFGTADAHSAQYVYDNLGRRIETHIDPTGADVTTRYVYDQNDNLVQTIDGNFNVTRFYYDNANRLIYTLDALNGLTKTEYDGNGRASKVTHYASALTGATFPLEPTRADIEARLPAIADATRDVAIRYTYDKDGREVAVAQLDAAGASLGTTLFFYDGNNNLLMTQDPTGVRAWSLYDQANRKVADIDGNGSVTEYRYNKSGEVTRTRAYATALTAAQLASLVDATGKPTHPALASIRPADTAADQQAWSIYDKAGRLAKTVDARGDVLEFDYDGAGHLRSTKAYATRIATATLSDIPSATDIAPPSDLANDRLTYNFYDSAGQLAASVDGEGFLTEFTYDGAGQLKRSHGYATALPENWRTLIPSWNANPATALASIRPGLTLDDVITWRLYDAAGRLSGIVNAENYLTEYVYDPAGNLSDTIRYESAVSVTVTPSSTLADIRPLDSIEDRRTILLYDQLNRVFEQINPEGTVNEYTYNALGQRVRTDRAAFSTEQRTSTLRYDQQGRLIRELAGEGSEKLQELLAGNPGATQAEIDQLWNDWGLTHTYDAAGRRTSTTDQVGNQTFFFYNVDGQLTHTVNALGEVSENKYNTLGQLTDTIRYGTRIDPPLAGGLVTPALIGAIALIADPALDSKMSFTYRVDGTLNTTTDALGVVTTCEYNAFHEKTTNTLVDTAEGRSFIHENVYDRRGLVHQERVHSEGPGAQANALNLTSEHDAFGRVISTLDTNNNFHQWSYDRLGRVVLVTDANNTTTSIMTYDAFDRVVTMTDALFNTTSFLYDRIERSQTVVTPELVVVKTIFNEHGQTQEVTDGNGAKTKYTYDKNGNLTEHLIENAQGEFVLATAKTYDRAMRLDATIDGEGHVVKLEYDPANRVVSRIVDPQGLNLATFYFYDAKGQRTDIIDPNNVVTVLEYDLAGQLTKRTLDPTGLNLVSEFSYDARGNTLSVKDPNGIETTYTFDAMGRRTSELRDESLIATYQYDGNGNMVLKTDANGNLCRYLYDANDRLILTLDQINATQASVTRQGYDDNGRLVKTTVYEIPIAVNLLEDVSLEDIEGLIEVGFDRVAYRIYDADGRLSTSVKVNDSFGDKLGELTQYIYDGANNIVESVSYANAVNLNDWDPSQALPLVTEDTARDRRVHTHYDGANRAIYTITYTTPTEREAGITPEPEIAVVARRYDGNGNVIEQTEYANAIFPADANLWSIEALEALIVDAADPSVDRRTVLTYDNANRLSFTFRNLDAGRTSATEQRYDGNGNVLKVIQYATALDPSAVPAFPTPSGDDRITVMTYDAANRLVFNIDALGEVAKRAYDANGNVVQTIGYHSRLNEPTADGLYTSEDVQAAVDDFNPQNRLSFATYDVMNRRVLLVEAVQNALDDGENLIQMGRVVRSDYDGVGNVIKTTAYAKLISLAEIDASTAASDLPNRIADAGLEEDSAHNRVTRNQFDARNRLIASLDALRYATQNDYNVFGEVTNTIRYAERITADTDVGGIVGAINDAINNGGIDLAKSRHETFGYDGVGRLIQSGDPLGASQSYTYDAVGNQLTFTNKNNATWTYQYDAAGRKIREISPQVQLTATMVNDDGGGVVIDDANTGLASVVTEYAYDSLGNLRFLTEAVGRPEQRLTEYQYDAVGRQVKTLYPDVWVYDVASDQGTFRSGANRLFSAIHYDALGNAISAIDTAGNTSFKTYDRVGNVFFEFDQEGGVSFHDRNAFGDEIGLTRFSVAHAGLLSGQGQTSLTFEQMFFIFLDGIGNHRTLSTERDLLGRAVKVTEPSGFVYEPNLDGGNYFSAAKTTRTSYTTFGEVFQVSVLDAPASAAGIDIWNYVTTNYYDQGGRLIEQVDALGYVTTQEYDAADNLVRRSEYETTLGEWNDQTWDPAQASSAEVPFFTPHFFEIPPVTTPAARVTDYQYDLADRKSAVIRRNVEFTNINALDPLNLQTLSGDLTTTYGYDAVGNLISTSDPSGAVTFTYYDALGRTRAVAAPAREGIVNPLPVFNDPAAPQLRTALPLSEFFTDALGNVVGKTDYAYGATSANAASYVRDTTASADDRRTLTLFDALGHAIEVAGPPTHRVADYDAGGRLARTSFRLAAGDHFQAYRYDKTGRLIETIDPPPQLNTQSSARFLTPISLPLLPGTNMLQIVWSGIIDLTAGAVRVSFNDTLGNPHSQTFANPLEVATVLSIIWSGPFSIINDITVEQQLAGEWVELYPDIGELSATITTTKYNTFGEVIERAMSGAGALPGKETFEYDSAGHLWRTNGGDGVTKVMLYDLEGRVTAEMTSSGLNSGLLGFNLSSLANPEAASGLVGQVRRTDSFYDALGRLVKTIAPARADLTYTVNAQALTVSTGGVSSAGPGFAPPGTEDGIYNGKPIPATWGTSSVDVNIGALLLPSSGSGIGAGGNAISQLGTGEVKAIINYQSIAYGLPTWREFQSEGGTVLHEGETEPGVNNQTKTVVLGSGGQTTGTLHFTWTDVGSVGGIDHVNSVQLFKKDVMGMWHLIGSITPQAPVSKASLFIPAPQDGSEVKLSLTIGGNPAPVTPAVVNFGDVLYYDLSTLPAGTYNYTVELIPVDRHLEDTRIVGTGTVTVSGASASRVVATGDNSDPVRPVIERSFDRWGNLLTVTDPRSAHWVTSYAYNASNQVTQVTQPGQVVEEGGGVFNPVTKIFYDKNGQRVGTAELNRRFDEGLETYVNRFNVNTTRYDAGGNVIAEHHADGGAMHYTYNFFGDKVVSKDALNNETRLQVDQSGNVTKIVHPQVTQGYIGKNPFSNTLPAVIEEFTYDDMGNRLTHTISSEAEDAPTYTTSYHYDARGNLIETIQPMGQRTKMQYDRANHKIAEVDANLERTTWTYDYFGRLTGHQDMGGAVYTYTYDNAGQLIAQGNTRKQSLSYTYDAAGQLLRVDEQLNDDANAVNIKFETTRYAYDLAGNRVLERTSVASEASQDNHMRYDAQRRLTDVADTRVAMHIDYDLLGNRTHIHTNLGADGLTTFDYSEDRYFIYDVMNRQVVVDSYSATSADIRERGHYLTYDLNGNRTSDTHWVEKRIAMQRNDNGPPAVDQYGRHSSATYHNSGAGLQTERYRYDSNNRLQSRLVYNYDEERFFNERFDAIETNDLIMDYRYYDVRGLVTQTGPAIPDVLNYGALADPQNEHVKGTEFRLNRYDDNGRLVLQNIFSNDPELFWVESGGAAFDPAARLMYTLIYGDFVGNTDVIANGYDAVGNVKKYHMIAEPDLGGYTNTYEYTYQRFEGYQTDTITGTSTKYAPGKTLNFYDLNGNLVRVDDTKMDENDRTIVNDISGRALAMTQAGSQVVRQLLVNGEMLGSYGIAVDEKVPRNANQTPNFTQFVDFNFSFEPVSPNYPTAAPGDYTVRAGDTLQIIAYGAYGDASLWYVIADANGLSGSQALTPGMHLTIPSRVGTVHNNANTFKPYDPSRIPGDTIPFLPTQGGCGSWGQILIVVIAVVVAVVLSAITYGAASYLGGVLVAAALGAAAAQTAAAAVAIAVVAGAAAGAIGSIASQVITAGLDPNKSIGKDFNWGAVGKAAIIGGASAGILRGFDVGVAGNAITGSTLKAGIGNTGASFGARAGQTAVLGVERAAAAFTANAIGQGLAIQMGWQKQWSWSEATSAAVSAGVGTIVGRGMDRLASEMETGILKDVIVNAPANFAGNVTAKKASMWFFNEGKLDWAQVAADAFGNALGNAIGGKYDLIRKQDAAQQLRMRQETIQKMQRILEAANAKAAADARYFDLSLEISQADFRLEEPTMEVTPSMYSSLGASPEEQEWNRLQEEFRSDPANAALPGAYAQLSGGIPWRPGMEPSDIPEPPVPRALQDPRQPWIYMGGEQGRGWVQMRMMDASNAAMVPRPAPHDVSFDEDFINSLPVDVPVGTTGPNAPFTDAAQLGMNLSLGVPSLQLGGQSSSSVPQMTPISGLPSPDVSPLESNLPNFTPVGPEPISAPTTPAEPSKRIGDYVVATVRRTPVLGRNNSYIPREDRSFWETSKLTWSRRSTDDRVWRDLFFENTVNTRYDRVLKSYEPPISNGMVPGPKNDLARRASEYVNGNAVRVTGAVDITLWGGPNALLGKKFEKPLVFDVPLGPSPWKDRHQIGKSLFNYEYVVGAHANLSSWAQIRPLKAFFADVRPKDLLAKQIKTKNQFRDHMLIDASAKFGVELAYGRLFTEGHDPKGAMAGSGWSLTTSLSTAVVQIGTDAAHRSRKGVRQGGLDMQFEMAAVQWHAEFATPFFVIPGHREIGNASVLASLDVNIGSIGRGIYFGVGKSKDANGGLKYAPVIGGSASGGRTLGFRFGLTGVVRPNPKYEGFVDAAANIINMGGEAAYNLQDQAMHGAGIVGFKSPATPIPNTPLSPLVAEVEGMRTMRYMRGTGRFFTYAGVAIDSVSVGSEMNKSIQTGNWSNTARESVRVASAWGTAYAGAAAGAAGGAAVGAAIGVWFFGVGAVPGAALGSALGFLGGAIGGYIGYQAGSQGGLAIYDAADAAVTAIKNSPPPVIEPYRGMYTPF